MTAFSAAIDAIFADPNMAADAVWHFCTGGDAVPCRIVQARPDEMSNFGESRIVSETLRFDVRVSEVANPRKGDQIEIGGVLYRVQGEPRRDRLRLVWKCEAVG